MQIIKIIIISFVTISSCLAQNYLDVLRYSNSNSESSARSLGMGNSSMTMGNDLSGVLFNPASLALAEFSQLSFGINFNTVDTKSRFFGNSSSVDKSKNNFGQIGFISPIPTKRGRLAFAVSYNRINDFSKTINFGGFNSSNTSMIKTLTNANDDLAYKLGLSFPVNENNVYKYDDTKINGNLYQQGNISESGYYDKASIAMAVEWSKNLFIGFNFNIFYGEYSQNRIYNEIDSKDFYGADLLLDDDDDRTRDFQLFEFNDKIVQDVSGYGFTVGFLYKLRNGIRFAGSIKSPDFINIEERYSVRGYSQFQDHEFETNWLYSDVEYDVRTPYEFSFGTSLTRKNLTFSANVTIINYRQMEFEDGFSSIDIDEKNAVIDDNFRTVANFNFGGEYSLRKIPLKLRGGFIYKRSPYKNDESKYDKKYITAGFGYDLTENLVLDVAYIYGWWEDIGDNYGTNVSRTFQKLKKSNLTANFTMRL